MIQIADQLDSDMNVCLFNFDKNKALYKKLYGFDFSDDKSVFDLIINTDNLTAKQVIDVTKETVRKLL